MSTVESPCIRLCVMDDRTGLCIGCGRTLAEIAGWMGYSTVERTAIMARLPGRLQDLAKAPDGQRETEQR